MHSILRAILSRNWYRGFGIHLKAQEYLPIYMIEDVTLRDPHIRRTRASGTVVPQDVWRTISGQ
jgi:hypothetical protein